MTTFERVFRGGGIAFLLFFIVGAVIHGTPPKVGASADTLVSFYDGDSTRILIASVFFGFALLNLMWFAVALSSALRDAGFGGWGSAAVAAAGALGGVIFVLLTVDAVLAYSIAGTGNDALVSGLNDLIWVAGSLAAFPTAMLVMSGSFGLWRAGLISNAMFGAGVTTMVLVLARTTTWASDGFWAPDGAYAQYVAPIVVGLWIVAFSRVILGAESVDAERLRPRGRAGALTLHTPTRQGTPAAARPPAFLSL